MNVDRAPSQKLLKQKPAPAGVRLSWPADRVERRPLAELIPYARNAKLHTAEQVSAIAASMREFGWTMPVLADETGGIIAGHGRVLAAQKLGYSEAPVMIAAGWTPAQVRAYRLADNKLTMIGGWDEELLGGELADLLQLGADLSLTGFSGAEIDQIFAPPTDPMREWEGMPEYRQDSQGAYKTIAVHFPDQAALDAFGKLLGYPITNRWIWYPRRPYEAQADQEWASG